MPNKTKTMLHCLVCGGDVSAWPLCKECGFRHRVIPEDEPEELESYKLDIRNAKQEWQQCLRENNESAPADSGISQPKQHAIPDPKDHGPDKPTCRTEEGPPKTNLHLHYRHPGYVREVCTRLPEWVDLLITLGDTYVLVCRRDDIPDLFASGLIESTVFERGERRFKLSVCALLLENRRGIFDAVLNDYELYVDDPFESVLIRCLESDSKEQMREHIEQMHEGKGAFSPMIEAIGFNNLTSFAAMSFRLLGCTEFAEINLRTAMETCRSAQQYAICSVLWKRLLDDDTQAALALIDAEKNAGSNSSEWLVCARAWLCLFGNGKEAERCRNKAVECADGSEDADVLISAMAWMLLFNDSRRARRCLEQAHAAGGRSTSELRVMAEMWVGLFKDHDRARQCIEESAHMGAELDDLAQCAALCIDLFNDTSMAAQVLQKAEREITDTGGLLSLAVIWENLLGLQEPIRRCLEQAGERAENLNDWHMIAEAWDDLLNAENGVRCALEKMKSCADDVADWTCIAAAEKKLLNDERSAMESMDKAERMAETTADCLSWAKVWREEFEVLDDYSWFAHKKRETTRIDEAVRRAETASDWIACAMMRSKSGENEKGWACLSAATNSASGFSEWYRCAGLWIYLFGEKEKARQCLEAAVGCVDNYDDWMRCHTSWMDFLQNTEEADRCLLKTNCLAYPPSDLEECRSAWKHMFSERQAPLKCMLEMEKTARDAQDYVNYAAWWKTLFNNGNASRRCLVEAVKYAGNLQDWIACAKCWGRMLNEPERAERCLQEAKKYVQTPQEKEFYTAEREALCGRAETIV